MNERLNVGIIGVGTISQTHISQYQAYPRANLYAICDSDTEWLADAAELYKPEKSFHNYHDMLADPQLDAVSICLPTGYHAEATVAALRAGKHVLCEKPMAINANEARVMRDVAQSTGKKLMISQNQRFEENVQLMKRHAEDGFFGEIYLIRIGWRRPLGIMPLHETLRPNGKKYNHNFFNEKDNGGGVLRDLGSHLLDLSLYIAGFPDLTHTMSSLYRKFYPDDYQPEKYGCDAEDMAVSQMLFTNGLTMQLEVSYGSFVEDSLVFTDIYGTKGGASRRNGELKFFSKKDNLVETSKVGQYDFVSKSAQQRFVDAVLDGTEVPVPPEEGIRVIEVLDAIYASAGEIRR